MIRWALTAPADFFDGLMSETLELTVRLAADEAELRAAQALRYQVFYDEMGASPTPEMAAAGLDFDAFDAHCNHLLVIGGGAVVGTYRLLSGDRALDGPGFYSSAEYDLGPLMSAADPAGLLECGRSCIDGRFRNKATIQKLWRGIAQYIADHKSKSLFGCASFPGPDPAAFAEPLSFLHHHRLAAPEFRAAAHAGRKHRLDMTPAGGVDARRALCAMPPLIKGYLRLGARVGDGAVVDEQFGTTDVLIILPVSAISDRYRRDRRFRL